MLKIWLSCCWITWAVFAVAQPARLLTEGRVEPAQFMEVLQVEYENGLIFVPVLIKGKKYRLLLDTGASNSIASRVAEEVGATYLADSIIYGDINKASSKTTFVHLEEVQLGKLHLKGFNFIVMDSPLYDLFNFDGIIGSNTFRGLVLQFDRKQSLVSITDDSKKLALKKSKGGKLSLSKYQLLPDFVVELDSCGKKRRWVTFDSGYSGWFSMAREDWPALKIQNPSWRVVSTTKNNSTMGMYGGTKDTTGLLLIQAPFLKTQQGVWPNNIITLSFSEGARMGGTLLKVAKVTLDYKNKRFFVEPYEQKIIEEGLELYRARELMGIGFSLEDGNFVVNSVWTDLAAAIAGVQVGLIVKKVNGVPFTDKTPDFISRYLQDLDWTSEVLIEGHYPNQPLQLYTLKARL